MSLLKVLTDIDGRVVTLPARIVSKEEANFTIRYLSPTDKRDQRNRRIYSYEDDTYVITDESITEYTETDSELYLGFKEISPGEFIRFDIDSDDDDEDMDDDIYEEEEEDEEEDDEEEEEEEAEEYE
jgi:hypothetical protein